MSQAGYISSAWLIVLHIKTAPEISDAVLFLLEKFSSDLFHRLIEFFLGGILEDEESAVICCADSFGDIEVYTCDIFVPVFKLPCITVASSVDHTLVADLRICFDPDNFKHCALFRKASLEVIDIFLVADLSCERSIDKNDVSIVESLECEVENCIILIITDILLKEIGASVVFLICNNEDLL